MSFSSDAWSNWLCRCACDPTTNTHRANAVQYEDNASVLTRHMKTHKELWAALENITAPTASDGTPKTRDTFIVSPRSEHW